MSCHILQTMKSSMCNNQGQEQRFRRCRAKIEQMKQVYSYFRSIDRCSTKRTYICEYKKDRTPSKHLNKLLPEVPVDELLANFRFILMHTDQKYESLHLEM